MIAISSVPTALVFDYNYNVWPNNNNKDLSGHQTIITDSEATEL